jgi:signal transduction histidine kinase
MGIRKPLLLTIALLVPAKLLAAEALPRTILFLDQSETRGPFYQEVYSGFRDAVNADLDSHVTVYRESLDLSRFAGASYEQTLHDYLQEKYRDRPIGAVVAIGAGTLELVRRWRAELWQHTPVVFALVDEAYLASLPPMSGVTGGVVKLPLADAITAARAVVPTLDSVALVGDAWDRQVVFKSWKDEIASATAGFKVIELIGLTMREMRQRVAELPDRSAIIYSAVYSDGEGAFYPPATALALIAQKANRPIVVASEPSLEAGGIGGFVLLPAIIGAEAGRRALRVIQGEAASNIPVSPAEGAVKPIFNGQQMQRWNVREADLPPGSEIRFREASFWENYRWQSLSVAAAILCQAVLIAFLLHERKRRGKAEIEAQHRMSELAHLQRQATAGELSSSLAHELNQPLGAILTNAETAELILNSPIPDLTEIKQILTDIRQDDIRASQVIVHTRSLLKRTPFELKEIDVNEVVRNAFDLMLPQASTRKVALYLQTCRTPVQIKGDAIQLQQVLLNLIANGMDAMASIPSGRTIIGRTDIGKGRALISILDSGSGIAPNELKQIFDRFFTTKEQGMGVGLSIARTIVQAHKGQIWAENEREGGAVFWISLSLS